MTTQHVNLIQLTRETDWGKISQLVSSLKGTKGLHFDYDKYTRLHFIVSWTDGATAAAEKVRQDAALLGAHTGETTLHTLDDLQEM